MTKFIAEPTLELRSDTSDWCKGWDDVIKNFYVSSYDADGNGIAGQKITLAPADDTVTATVELQNVPVTDENGTAVLQAKLTIVDDAPFALVASVEAGGGSSSLFAGTTSDPLILDVRAEELAVPRIPPALDGVIDDTDYANGVAASVIASNMHRGDTVYLIWGDTTMEQSVSEDAGSYTFELAGIDTTANELMFQNQTYLVRAFVADVAGNGRYSKATHVKVNRANGGSGMAFLSELTITEGKDGIINEAEAKYGVSVVLPNDTVTWTNANNEPQPDITDPLSKSTASSISLVALNKKDQVINTLSIPLPNTLTPLVNNTYIYNERTSQIVPTVLRDFLMSIGEGSVKASYNLTIDGVVFSSQEVAIYAVDVIPPGSL